VTDPQTIATQGHLAFKDRPFVRWFMGAVVLGGYLRLIRATSRIIIDPPDFWEKAESTTPLIGVSWHGQSNLAYFLTPRQERFALLISNHPDGRMAAAMGRSFGFKTIDGSGASDRQSQSTGGLSAFRGMMRALKDGLSLFLTADIPPVPGRNIAPGVIAIARRSGRPVYAIATASSRQRILTRVWDQMQLNYPFSHVVFAGEGPLWMTDTERSDESYAEELRVMLDRALARAFALAEGARQ
jgi:lysophospholipid acyltransferase (LPLAT)-like uncharacterized protein